MRGVCGRQNCRDGVAWMGSVFAEVVVIKVKATDHGPVRECRQLWRTLDAGAKDTRVKTALNVSRDAPRDDGRFGRKGAQGAAHGIDEPLLDRVNYAGSEVPKIQSGSKRNDTAFGGIHCEILLPIAGGISRAAAPSLAPETVRLREAVGFEDL